MSNLKTSQQYFSDLVAQNRAKMKLPDAFDVAKRTFEREKGLAAPYNDSESFRTSTRNRRN